MKQLIDTFRMTKPQSDHGTKGPDSSAAPSPGGSLVDVQSNEISSSAMSSIFENDGMDSISINTGMTPRACDLADFPIIVESPRDDDGQMAANRSEAVQKACTAIV